MTKKVSKKVTKKAASGKVYWYASTDYVRWMGPYSTQEEAWASTIGLNKVPVKGSIVWCSKVVLGMEDGAPVKNRYDQMFVRVGSL